MSSHLHGFDRDDLAAMADGLDCYQQTINVGTLVDEEPESHHVESTTAAAAKFIRAALAASSPDATPTAADRSISSRGLAALPDGAVCGGSGELDCQYPGCSCHASKSQPPPLQADQPVAGPVWTLFAPDGRRWQGESPLRACAAAQRDTIDPVLAMQRINAAVAEEQALHDAELSDAYQRGRSDELADIGRERPTSIGKAGALADSGAGERSEPPADALGAPASPSGSTLQPSVSAAIPSAWISVDERPSPKDGSTFLVTCEAGLVAPHIGGVIHNNVGTPWAWNYGEAITHWMPLPEPPARGIVTPTGANPEGMSAEGIEPGGEATRPETSAGERQPATPETWQALYDAADAIHGALDQQTYDEKRRADWELPDDHPFEVTISAALDRALSKAICGVEAARLATIDVAELRDECKRLVVELRSRCVEYGMSHGEEANIHEAIACTAEEDLDAAIDRLAQAAAAGVPQGWRLVPIEATPEMVAAYLAGNDAYWRRADEVPPSPGTWRSGTPSEATAESYRAMLAAAPLSDQPEGQPGAPAA